METMKFPFSDAPNTACFLITNSVRKNGKSVDGNTA